jgi:hypothetical protein
MLIDLKVCMLLNSVTNRETILNDLLLESKDFKVFVDVVLRCVLKLIICNAVSTSEPLNSMHAITQSHRICHRHA